MTNYQLAKKNGMIQWIPSSASEYRCAMTSNGLAITSEEMTLCSLKCIVGEIETSRGTLRVYCGTNGTARIDKPNGTHKWFYEKSANQMSAVIRQTLNFYKA